MISFPSFRYIDDLFNRTDQWRCCDIVPLKRTSFVWVEQAVPLQNCKSLSSCVSLQLHQWLFVIGRYLSTWTFPSEKINFEINQKYKLLAKFRKNVPNKILTNYLKSIT